MNRNPLMELNSQQLQTLQNVMVERIQEETKKPDADFSMIAAWSEITAMIDTQRRHVWHDEKFGAYEEIADTVLELTPSCRQCGAKGFTGLCEQCEQMNNRNFASDDIPF